MLCVVIVGPTVEEAEEQVAQANRFGDLIEFRLDRFSFSGEKIAELKEKVRLPVIFAYPGKELAIEPEYVDVPYDTSIEEVRIRFPNAKIIRSYHNYVETPQDLETILDSMQHSEVSYYKIATMAQSTNDSLRMLQFLRKQRKPIIGLCMGEHGRITRILAQIYGGLFTYCSVDDQHTGAPGQIDVQTLLENFHYSTLNRDTKVLGLIGDPVDRSPADVTHNAVMRQMDINGVYVKMVVPPDQLEEFIQRAKVLGFYGFSVTIPLKEKVIPYIHEFAEQSDAINTLHFDVQKIRGKNTDGIGALDAIEEKMPVDGQRVMMLGAGGAAKGVAYEARKRGAQVVVLNRTPEKAKALAASVEGEWGSFDDFDQLAEKGYDVIINAIAHSAGALPFFDRLLQDRVAMDVVYGPQETPFLLAAKAKGCTLVHGFDMYVRQAVKQFSFWFGESIDEQQVRKTLEDSLQKKVYGQLQN